MPLYELDDPTPQEAELLESISQNPELFRRALVVDMISRRRRCSEHNARLEALEKRADYQNGEASATARATGGHRPVARRWQPSWRWIAATALVLGSMTFGLSAGWRSGKAPSKDELVSAVLDALRGAKTP